MSTSSEARSGLRRTPLRIALLGALIIAPALAAIPASAEPGGSSITTHSAPQIQCPGEAVPHPAGCLALGSQGAFTSDDYDVFGYDDFGYDRSGYDRTGYDRSGYDRTGNDRFGYDRQGYDESGRDSFGRDRSGYDRFGYDRFGYNRVGLNSEGYTRTGCRVDGNDRPEADRAACDVWRALLAAGIAG